MPATPHRILVAHPLKGYCRVSFRHADAAVRPLRKPHTYALASALTRADVYSLTRVDLSFQSNTRKCFKVCILQDGVAVFFLQCHPLCEYERVRVFHF